MEDDELELPVASTTIYRPVNIPSLRDVCVTALTRYRQYLGDVGYMDPESLRAVAWHCNPEQLATIEDETLSGSGRDLEWYTWHLWRRLLTTELGASTDEVPTLTSPEPVDYTPPRGIDAEPGDYRALFLLRKEELAERSAAARERIAAAYQQAQELKDSRKAKMIDKLAPAKRQRHSSTAAGTRNPANSAFLHKPRADSRSSFMAKPGAQLKVLKDLGLLKPAGSTKSTSTVRVIKSSPVPSAATGRSSNLAGAALLHKATGGQLGKASVGAGGSGSGSGGRLHVEAQPPLVAARAAAVAAAAATRTAGKNGGAGASSAAASAAGFLRPGTTAASAAAAAGSKRPASGVPGGQQPAAKVQVGDSAGAARQGAGATGGRGSGGARGGPDPRVMFPRQSPQLGAGVSKFAVPSARPLNAMSPVGAAGPPGLKSPEVGGPQRGGSGMRSSDDL